MVTRRYALALAKAIRQCLFGLGVTSRYLAARRRRRALGKRAELDFPDWCAEMMGGLPSETSEAGAVWKALSFGLRLPAGKLRSSDRFDEIAMGAAGWMDIQDSFDGTAIELAKIKGGLYAEVEKALSRRAPATVGELVRYACHYCETEDVGKTG